MYDLRHERDHRTPARKVKWWNRPHPDTFAPGAVRGVVLHQTAAPFAQPRGTADELSLARRALGVACHAMAFRAGFFVAAAPLDWVVNHGNGFNRHAFGLEVDGLYPGLERRRLPNHTVLEDRTVEAACEALRWLVEEWRRMGHPVTHLWAHRQSSADRRADPGEALWHRVALEFAVPVLGLVTEPALWLPASNPKNGPGRPIPVEWDPRGVGHY